jgi:hypothetical protein
VHRGLALDEQVARIAAERLELVALPAGELDAGISQHPSAVREPSDGGRAYVRIEAVGTICEPMDHTFVPRAGVGTPSEYAATEVFRAANVRLEAVQPSRESAHPSELPAGKRLFPPPAAGDEGEAEGDQDEDSHALTLSALSRLLQPP